MKLFEFYFDTNVGLRKPSQVFQGLCTLTCWIFNISGVILAGLSVISLIRLMFVHFTFWSFLGCTLGCIFSPLLILTVYKFLGWFCALPLRSRSITLAAHEKFLEMDTSFLAQLNASPIIPNDVRNPQPCSSSTAPTGTAAVSKVSSVQVPVQSSEPEEDTAWHCSYCGTSNHFHAIFCRKCNELRTK